MKHKILYILLFIVGNGVLIYIDRLCFQNQPVWGFTAIFFHFLYKFINTDSGKIIAIRNKIINVIDHPS